MPILCDLPRMHKLSISFYSLDIFFFSSVIKVILSDAILDVRDSFCSYLALKFHARCIVHFLCSIHLRLDYNHVAWLPYLPIYTFPEFEFTVFALSLYLQKFSLMGRISTDTNSGGMADFFLCKKKD